MKRMLLAMILTLALAGPESSGAPAPGTPAARHEAVVAHLKKVAAEASARSLADVKGPDDWEARRASARRQLLYVLGLDPLPEHTPLEAKVTGTVRRPGFRVEKVVFQSLPRLYVTANFYLPDPPAGAAATDLPRKLPTVLYVCGHPPGPAGAKAH